MRALRRASSSRRPWRTEILLVGAEGRKKLFFDVAVGAWHDGVPKLPNCGEKAHRSSAFLARMPATTAAISVHLAVSALSWRLPAAVSE